MGSKKIYSVYDNGERIGSYTAEDAEKLLGIQKSQVAVYAKNDWKYSKRYSFVPENYEPSAKRFNDKLANDWDYTVKTFLMLAGR